MKSSHILLPALAALGLACAPALAQSNAAQDKAQAPAVEAPAETGPDAAGNATQPDSLSDARADTVSPEEAARSQGDVGAVEFKFPEGGTEEQVTLIAGLCGMQIKNMSALACRCLAEQAIDGLNPVQRDYLVATAVSPPLAENMLGGGQVVQEDLRTIFTFLEETRAACATGTYVEPADATGGDAPAPAAAPESPEENARSGGDADPAGSAGAAD